MSKRTKCARPLYAGSAVVILLAYVGCSRPADDRVSDGGRKTADSGMGKGGQTTGSVGDDPHAYTTGSPDDMTVDEFRAAIKAVHFRKGPGYRKIVALPTMTAYLTHVEPKDFKDVLVAEIDPESTSYVFDPTNDKLEGGRFLARMTNVDPNGRTKGLYQGADGEHWEKDEVAYWWVRIKMHGDTMGSGAYYYVDEHANKVKQLSPTSGPVFYSNHGTTWTKPYADWGRAEDESDEDDKAGPGTRFNPSWITCSGGCCSGKRVRSRETGLGNESRTR